MKLQTYLARQKIGYAEFARMIASPHRRNVQRYALGLRQPKHDTMRRIYEVTHGEVTPQDFVAVADFSAGVQAEGTSAEADDAS